MFMGPLEMVKPWSTKGVEGVYRFLGRVWRLFIDEKSQVDFEQTLSTAATPTAELLNTIRLNPKIQDTQHRLPPNSKSSTPPSRKSPKTSKLSASTPPSPPS